MLWIVLAIVAVIVIYLIVAYNGLIRGRNQIENAWSQIDVQLKRRIDLIPNLVETVKAYAAHEKETLDAVLVEPGDVDALAVALRRVLFEPGLSTRLQHAGSHRAEDFSMTVLAKRYAEHYVRLATSRPRRERPPTRESFWRSWRRRMMAD